MDIREELIWFPDNQDDCSYTAELYHLNSMVTLCNSEKYGKYIEYLSSNPVISKEWASDDREMSHLDALELPNPRAIDDPLTKVISKRTSSSSYSYTNQPTRLECLSTILHYSMGIIDSDSDQTRFANPSAGALYSCKGYTILFNVDDISPGIYHYNPSGHRLESIENGDFREWLGTAVFSDGITDRASGAIVLTVRLDRALLKYNERGYRYALFEAGHIAQNIVLTTSALNMASTPIGGFIDSELNTRLNLSQDREYSVYVIMFGRFAVGR